jgi:hypothetical protein
MKSFEVVYDAVHQQLVKPFQMRGSKYEDLAKLAKRLDERCSSRPGASVSPCPTR